MRVFAWEYVTSGGWRECQAPKSLIAEGAMMLRALATDLAACGAEVIVAADPELPLEAMPGRVAVVDPADLWESWRRIIATTEAVWPVAPETDGILEAATALILREGRILLNSRPEALAIARSKHATSEHLARAGIPVVPSFPLDAILPEAPQGWVAKPDDGAGATDTFLFCDNGALAAWRQTHPGGNFILQPFLPGTPMSLSLVVRDGACHLLSCNLQQICCIDGVLSYRGGIVGGGESRREALAPLAERIAGSVPGLWGYVGIDLVDSPEGPIILEINPRLTTSYVALSASLGWNPAGLVLGFAEPDLARRVQPVEITVPES
jgi:tyramine---L-glutamate ligase